MRASIVARRTPLIKFLGKRVFPAADHSPRVHSQDPHGSLPSSFVQYRLNAQQHGPLSASSSAGSRRITGSIAPAPGEFFSRNDLPPRYRYAPLDELEMEAVNSGGAF
ncbi:hypothetical protein BZA70DRAFT_290101 [Myxozyma melibiosi]|uniref:37S ribosomal protein YMR-31, mitochondrial n=1 Tax=Myxozyma melibiosi TaxID=54550 RepID=A0ABR1F4N0_9ASCO